MLQELNTERQQAVIARDRARREGKLINVAKVHTISVAAGAAVTATPSKTPAGIPEMPIRRAARSIGVSAPVLQGALMAALPTVVMGLAAVSQASPEERAKAWKETVLNVVKSLGLGGMAGHLVEKIRAVLLDFGPKLVDTAWLATKAKRLKISAASAAGTIAFAAVDLGYQGIRWFWHRICYEWAKRNGDEETAKIESEQMSNILSMDNACLCLAHVLTQAASTSAATWIVGAGLATSAGVLTFTTLVMPALAICIADGLARAMLESKNAAGGWGPYLKSFFIQDRREFCWTGEGFEQHEKDIPDGLECEITHEIL